MIMRKKYIIIYTLYFIYASLIVVNSMGDISMDEIWNFEFSKRIAEGYIPYRDYNIVTTPLFFFIGALFSKNLMIFRLYGALINAAIPTITYYYCEKNGLDKQLSIVMTFASCVFLIGVDANYNYMLLVGMMISCLIANNFFYNKDSKNSFLFGLSLSIILLIKQNIPGILIIVFTCILLIMLFRKKINHKIFICYALGGVIPVFILIIYLLLNGALMDFIDYTILGLNSFSNNLGIDRESLIAITPALIVTFIIGAELFKNKNFTSINYSTLVFSIASYAIIFPILNMPHAIMLFVFNIFLFIPLLKNIRLKSKLIKILVYLIYIVFLIGFITQKDDDYVRTDIDIYKNILVKREFDENTKVIFEYIKEQEKNGIDVAMVNEYSYLYMIPANDNNGVLDLLSVGNVGTLSNEDIILLIDNKDIILTNDYYFFQDIKDVREYVFENYTQIGTVGNMGIYKKQ